MKELSELAMTDIGTRSRGGRQWRLGVCSVLVVFCYVLIRNFLYVKAGMLRPNFTEIHKAYDFNLWELPMTLIGVAVFFALLAATWRGLRKELIWIALLFAFIAVDLLGLRYYVTNLEPQRLVVHHVRLETPKLTQPIRLLHISDIQAGSISEYEVEIFEQIKALSPDLILNTGDFLQVVPPATFASEFPKLLALIKEVNPRLYVCGVWRHRA